MRILFVMSYPGFLRYFDSTVARLVENGHEIVISFDRPDVQAEGLVALEALGERVTVLPPLPRRVGTHGRVVRSHRGALDYVRYLDPAFASASGLRDRRRKALAYSPLFGFLGRFSALPRWQAQLLITFFLAVERSLDSEPAVDRALRDVAPDVVLVTPLVSAASPQTDVVKSARTLGVPCGLCVASWDHLTSKGMMRVVPDRVFLWNETQRREATSLHRVPDDRVVVTGAQPFDRWFGREPTLTRSDFCLKVGLSSSRPFLLFVGSTVGISRPDAEEQFVLEWIRRLAASEMLRDYGILIRPHPYNPGLWHESRLVDGDRIAVWPKNGANPVDEADRADYFDSLYHSAAVVGINTSAMIEAAIVGRPVLTIVSEAFQRTQTGTLHFRYLVSASEGFVESATDFSEHIRQLERVIADPGLVSPRTEAFVEAFVRPFGEEVESTPRLVEGIESLGRECVTPHGAPAHLAPLRGLVTAATIATAVTDVPRLARLIERSGLVAARRIDDYAALTAPRSNQAAHLLRRCSYWSKRGSRTVAAALRARSSPEARSLVS